MKLTKEERRANRQAFRGMSWSKRLDYLLTYYRLALLLGIAALLVVGSMIRGQLTKKEPLLYVGLLNVTIGSELEAKLTTDWVTQLVDAPKRSSVELYQGLYLTDDPSSEAYQYVYASRMKLLAMLESKQLDVVLMNREAYDTLSQSGYLLELEGLLGSDGDLGGDARLADGARPGGDARLGDDARLARYLVRNLVIYKDNAEAHAMDESIPYEAVTGEEVNGLDCSAWPVFAKAGFQEPVYLGVIANSPRTEQSRNYIRALRSR